MGNRKDSQIELKTLLLEDSLRDAELICDFLEQKSLYDIRIKIVQNKKEYLSELNNNEFDLILSDFQLNEFDGFEALKLSKDANQVTPFIIVSGVIGEEIAAELIKLGATDFVSKDKLERLLPSIERALIERKDNLESIRVRKELEHSHDLMSHVLNSTSEGIYGVDCDGTCTFINKSGLNILGYSSSSELVGRNMHNLTHYEHKDGTSYLMTECNIVEAIKKGYSLHFDNEVAVRKDGSKISVEYSSNPQIEKGKVQGAVISFRDISERLIYQDSLIHASYNDSLTNLYNRRHYDKEINNLHSSENYPLTIVVGDIDGLKFINDSFGHYAGDEYLIEVANILKSSCKEDTLIARMGGDEFVMVLRKTSGKDVEKLIDRICKKLQNVEIYSIPISVSFGFSTVNYPEDDILNIYNKAENAMYQEKILVNKSMRSDAIETMLQTLNEKDSCSERHSRQVALISERLATSYGMNRHDIKEVRTIGLLHDIGKIIISSKILNKVGKLTEQEYGEIKKHSEIGFRILSASRNMKEISNFVLSHHERWDGKGYPRGIKGDNTPIQSRIISLADAFDAMTSERKYREAVSKTEALEEIKRNSGTQFDPELVIIFERDFKTITDF